MTIADAWCVSTRINSYQSISHPLLTKKLWTQNQIEQIKSRKVQASFSRDSGGGAGSGLWRETNWILPLLESSVSARENEVRPQEAGGPDVGVVEVAVINVVADVEVMVPDGSKRYVTVRYGTRLTRGSSVGPMGQPAPGPIWASALARSAVALSALGTARSHNRRGARNAWLRRRESWPNRLVQHHEPASSCLFRLRCA